MNTTINTKNESLYTYNAEHLLDYFIDCIKQAKSQNGVCRFEIKSVEIKNEDNRQNIIIEFEDGNIITFTSHHSQVIDEFNSTHNVASVESSFGTNKRMIEKW